MSLSPIPPEVWREMKRVRRLAHNASEQACIAADAAQNLLFGLRPSEVPTINVNTTITVDGVNLNPTRLEGIKTCLLAKYLHRVLSMSEREVADVMNTTAPYVHRLIHRSLPACLPTPRERAKKMMVDRENGMNCTKRDRSEEEAPF